MQSQFTFDEGLFPDAVHTHTNNKICPRLNDGYGCSLTSSITLRTVRSGNRLEKLIASSCRKIIRQILIIITAINKLYVL